MINLTQFIKENLPFPLTLFPDNCYLVGGAVRDVLLNRKKSDLDLDFVIPHSAIKVSKKIANNYHAGFVILDREREIARVVFPHSTIDLANQEGENINQDLGRRDYTINAIAFDCHREEILDPFCGQQDIQNRIIRMINRKNLEDDPLRLLRGYRQSCQLNFTIEANTHDTIKQLTSLLSKVAVERVNSELNYLFSHQHGSYWLQEAFKDGLLSFRHPCLTTEKIQYLEKIDRSAQWFREKWRKFESITPSYYQNAKLACFCDNIPEKAEMELINLKYSRQDIKTVTTILKYTPQLLDKSFSTDIVKQYFFFTAVGNIFPILAIFAHAHYIDSNFIIQMVDRYLDDDDMVAHSKPLLTGKEIMETLQIPPSHLIGELLTNVQIAYIQQKIKDKNEALDWLKKRY